MNFTHVLSHLSLLWCLILFCVWTVNDSGVLLRVLQQEFRIDESCQPPDTQDEAVVFPILSATPSILCEQEIHQHTSDVFLLCKSIGIGRSLVRNDIQFLRGFAVLSVLFYHADIIPLLGGYLGVDIFFVISGYLITSIILRDIDNGTFSFSGFYLRRAKRLLPAAYNTLIFTTLLSYAFLTVPQWTDYIKQLIGAVTFTANLVLPFQTGYFENAAEGKPLLHTWSLSVEEQYYLTIPFLIYLIPSKWRGWALLVGAVISLIACLTFVSFPFTYWRLPTIDSQTIAFFSLPTRAWEMLVGSLLAWKSSNSILAVPRKYKFAALLLIIVVTCFPIDSIHPRGDAVLVVLATAIILAGEKDWLPVNMVSRTMAKVGDFSYSLYLVHWPLFAFAHNAYLGDPPPLLKFALLLSAIALGYMQYQLVEQRFRYGWRANQKKTFQWLAGASLLVIVAPIPAVMGKQDQILEPSFLGLNSACALGKGSVGKELFAHPEICMTGKEPIFAVWGDSYAMHLIPGLRKDPRIGDSMIQITKSACAPIIGIASIDANYDEKWASGCLKFNDDAIKFLQNHDSIKYVIMSSPFGGYFDDGVLSQFHHGKQITGNRSIAIEQFVITINKLRAIGKFAIVVAPPPAADFNIGECWGRVQSGLPVYGRSDCNIRAEEYRANQRGIINGLLEAQNRTQVDIVWMDKVLCKESVCRTSINNTSIYRDGGHLSVSGSEWVMPQLNLTDRALSIRNTGSATSVLEHELLPR